MSDSIQLMFEGKHLLEIGDLDGAERVLRSATDLIHWVGGKPTGAYMLLGKVLLKKGNAYGAELAFESSLPDRDGFKGLISILRKWAKEAGADRKGALWMYTRMLNRAWQYAHWQEINNIMVDKSHEDRVEAWNEWMRSTRDASKLAGPFTYAEHGAPPGDRLLTVADYRKLHRLSFE